MNGPIIETASFAISPISAPTLLTGIIHQNPLRVELHWNDNSDNEDGFIIERENIITESFVVIDSVAQNETNYPDTSVAISTYNYRVKAYNQYTQSAYSDTIHLVVPVS